MSEQYNPQIFDNPDLWEDYDSAGEISAKVPLILEKIPADVESIIDVGCGNGAITNQFPQGMRVLGVDLSEEALRHVTREKLQRSCDDIHGVGDASFDLVFSSELLEHLPSDLVRKTLWEFDRITRKYIFIGVPHEEQLPFYLVKCPECQTSFHAYGHLNSFNADKLGELLGDSYRLIWTTTLGKKVRPYHPFLLKLRHRYAGKYFAPSPYTICPQCGNRDYPQHRGNLLSKLFNGLNLMVRAPLKDYWMMALFQKADPLKGE